MGETLPITIACHPYDRVRSLFDGSVTVEGCKTITLPLRAEEVFHRAYGHAAFEVSELSMSSYILTAARNTCPYIAIPVFTSRVFRHSSFYVRKDRGIAKPADLRGKTIGVPEYQMTAALWARGILKDLYDISSHEIKWRTGGLEIPGRIEKFGLKFDPPFDVKAVPTDKSLSNMLMAGELDGMVSARAPSSFSLPNSPIVRLFPNYKDVEKDYYRETGHFPIMHVIGIRRDVAAQHPWLAASVYKAFELAKANCMRSMNDLGALEVALPWLTSYIEETIELMGPNYWPYGFEENRKTLEAMARYSFEQGLAPRLVGIEELFAAGTHDRFKV
jgi:4,5-dihydroxyphthalate decarboxylase